MATFFDLEFDPVSPSDPFVASYPSLLNFYAEKRHFSADDFVCGVNMAFGWTPKMIVLHGKNGSGAVHFKKGAGIIKRARDAGHVDPDDLHWLISTIDNSVVTTSKLLHFVAPHSFAIWDSRVRRYLSKTDCANVTKAMNFAPYGKNKATTYLGYIAMLDELTKHRRFTALHGRVEQALAQKVSMFRAAEWAMYVHGEKK